jgi:MinD superfamily P-loop ATPase
MVVSAGSRRDLLRRWAAPVGRMTRAVTRPAVAWIAPDMCTAWSGSDCRVCEAVCPRPGAVRFAAGGRGPLVDRAVCDGCGLCVAACEQTGSAGAIRWVSR